LTIAITLFFFLAQGCGSVQKTRTRPPPKAQKTRPAKPRPNKLAVQNTSPLEIPKGAGSPPPSGVKSGKKFLLPSIVNRKDRSVMVLVPSGVYPSRKTIPPSKKVSGQKIKPDSRFLFAFYIDKTEITVSQYRRYDPGYNEKPHTEGSACPTCPAMGIDWYHANRDCLWAGKRLPREEEWEVSARGKSRTTWPWGNRFMPDRANLLGQTDGAFFAAPVGSYPKGSSVYGTLDMIGNVWEWVLRAGTKDMIADKKGLKLAKGGGWTSAPKTANISFRNWAHPAMKNPTFGFRCAKPARRSKRK
jgi:formylglycine-generating enzyme required for sulfatase activity